MEEQLRRRLEELKREFEAGQARLRELEAEQARVRDTLLRISGAIQVLEEALIQETKPGEAGASDSRAAGQVSGTS